MNYWWQTAQGIRSHFAEEREAAVADHQRRMKNIDTTENEMLDALEKHPIVK